MPETPEEKKVKEHISRAADKMKAIDERPNQQGFSPRLNPPGAGGMMGSNLDAKALSEAAKAKEKEVIRQEALDESAEAIKGAPTAAQTKAFKIADEFAYTEANPPELGKDKSVSEWQDHFMRGLGDRKEKQEQSRNDNPPMYTSQRFAASLSFNHIGTVDERPGRLKEMKTNGRDVTQEEQPPMSMSQRFTASLGYNNTSKADERSERLKEMKTNGRDMTKE